MSIAVFSWPSSNCLVAAVTAAVAAAAVTARIRIILLHHHHHHHHSCHPLPKRHWPNNTRPAVTVKLIHCSFERDTQEQEQTTNNYYKQQPLLLLRGMRRPLGWMGVSLHQNRWHEMKKGESILILYSFNRVSVLANLHLYFTLDNVLSWRARRNSHHFLDDTITQSWTVS